MPHIVESPRNSGQFVICLDTTPRSFLVSESTWYDWTQRVERDALIGPRNFRGHRLRPYPTFDVEVHGYAPDGVYVDHRCPNAERDVYAERDRLQGDQQEVLDSLAATFGFRHWRDVYNLVRNVGRRATGESGRDTAGQLRWRRWNTPRNMRQNTAAPARPGSRDDRSLVARRFGIEIEYNHDAGGSSRYDIVQRLNDNGINALEESYNHTTQPHWKMTYDATVTGGELVSPIMAGDTASLDEVRDCIRAVKAGGGTTNSRVGMHVHIDCTDFTDRDDRARLIDMLEATEHALSDFVIPARREGTTSCGAGLMQYGEWADVRYGVQSIMPGSRPGQHHDMGGSVNRYRFVNVEAPLRKYGTVEFRGLGGTLHAGKVRVWVRMCQAIVEAARQGIDMPANATRWQMVDTLRDAGLIGRRTGERFMSECNRRHPAMVAA